MFRRSLAFLLLSLQLCSDAYPQSLLDRGRYLVDAVMACDGCHSTRGPAGFDMTRRFSGGSQVWDEPTYTVRGSNITPDRQTGIGAWTPDDLRRLMVDGVRPSGVPVSPQMPYPFYKILTPRDLEAVVAYIRTAEPVRREVPPPVYKKPAEVHLIPGAEKPFAETDLENKLKRGFYLATIAHCMECHSRTLDGTPDYRNRWGKGGHVMSGPYGKVTVSNITSHPVKGVGAWSDDDLRRALTQGVGRDGRAFKNPMARQIYFSKMTSEDIDAIVAWVRTIPPLE